MDPVDRQRQRDEDLYEQFRASPMTELTGIVGARGATGGRGGKPQVQQLWTIGFSFDAWRIDGGPIRTEPLTIHRRVTYEELRQFQSMINGETIVRIRARLSKGDISGVVNGYLEEYIGSITDDVELLERLVQLQEPKTFHDEQFGTFTFDRSVSWYSASVQWVGKEIQLTLNIEGPDEIGPCLRIARALWSEESVWKARIEAFAVQELLPIKNEGWVDEDEAEVSPEEFKNKMTLESISIYADGTFNFWHLDGDLFWGHFISISGNLTDGPTGADIPG